MNMRTIRWGIIGCGDVAEVKSGPGFQKARNSALVAVMRRNAVLAEDFARRHGVPRWYTDAQALIHDPEVDAVYVATPPASHREYVLECAAAGKPVYCEKPMALNLAECEEMIAACQGAGVPLFVAYYRRALPRFLKVKELIDAGAIGDVRFVSVALQTPPQPDDLEPSKLAWRVQPEYSGGGRFVDVGCHMLDFLDYVLGPIVAAEGHAANRAGLYAAEDTVTAAFEFASGVPGSGAWCSVAYGNLDLTEIVGSQGKVSFACFDASPIRLTTASEVTDFPIPNPAHVQQPLIESVVDDLLGLDACPSTGVTAARTTRVIDNMLAGYRRAHQAVVTAGAD
jgi:1,5-anhydro-D-fructose reductase (1,5-anhydro-D-mannitol-forming)